MDSKEIKTVNSKGNQSWIFIERTDAEIPILWPPNSKNWHIGKDPEAGKDWRQEKKGTTKDKMIGWHHRLDGHEFEQSPGGSEGQLSLMFCSPLGHRDLDFRLNNNNNNNNKNIYIYNGVICLDVYVTINYSMVRRIRLQCITKLDL